MTQSTRPQGEMKYDGQTGGAIKRTEPPWGQRIDLVVVGGIRNQIVATTKTGLAQAWDGLTYELLI